MRQLATFETADHARRLTAYLVTQRIAAHAEEDGGKFSIWVRDEDQMAAAREALDHFRANPSDARYSGVETAAQALKRQQAAEREARQKNVVEMRGRWGSGAGGMRRKCPVTIGLIILSGLISLAANTLLNPDELGIKPPNEVFDSVSFVRHTERFNNFADVQRGQIWRLVTPAFIHFGLFHLIFNMWLMFVLGGQIEDRRGAKWYVTFMLLAAVLSNIAQASYMQWMNYPATFGGMSGVGYAVFGYLWMKVKFDPAAGFQLDKLNVIILMAWLVLCILRDFPTLAPVLGFLPHAANTAHVVGLLVGMAAGYAPLLLRRR